MPQLDGITRSRLSLFSLVAMVLSCAAWWQVSELAPHTPTPMRSEANHALGARPMDRAAAIEIVALRRLAELSQRSPSAAEWIRVLACLDHSSWIIKAAALRVLRTHHHSAREAAERRLLEQALTNTHSPLEADRPYQERLACKAVMLEILDGLIHPLDHRWKALVMEMLQRGPDGHSRTRALELLSQDPPQEWHRLVLGALGDSSERVRLKALDIVAQNRWADALPTIKSLAASSRPALRRQAGDVMRSFSDTGAILEYADAVHEAAGNLADQLWRAGFEYRDAVASIDHMARDRVEIELLDRTAEEYLDRSVDPSSEPRDFQGVLLLAAAVRAEHEKLVRRLWEHEISRADTDEELLEGGLEALARSRLLAGLAACRRGDHALALEELASLARISHATQRDSRAHLYVRQAGELSAAVWQGAVGQAAGRSRHRPANRVDPVMRIATELLENLDLNNHDQQQEARRRLESWCGLLPPVTADTRQSRMAN